MQSLQNRWSPLCHSAIAAHDGPPGSLRQAHVRRGDRARHRRRGHLAGSAGGAAREGAERWLGPDPPPRSPGLADLPMARREAIRRSRRRAEAGRRPRGSEGGRDSSAPQAGKTGAAGQRILEVLLEASPQTQQKLIEQGIQKGIQKGKLAGARAAVRPVAHAPAAGPERRRPRTHRGMLRLRDPGEAARPGCHRSQRQRSIAAAGASGLIC